MFTQLYWRAAVAVFIALLHPRAVTANLVAQDSVTFGNVFSQNGFAAFQGESVLTARKLLASDVLFGEAVVLETSAWEFLTNKTNFYFSPLLQLSLGRSLPPSFVFVFLASKSVDVEVCLSSEPVPCGPQDFRMVQLEEEDIFIADPTRCRFRLCNADNNMQGCEPPSQSAGDLRLYTSKRFLHKSEVYKKVNSANIGPIQNDDYQRLVELVNHFGRDHSKRQSSASH